MASIVLYGIGGVGFLCLLVALVLLERYTRYRPFGRLVRALGAVPRPSANSVRRLPWLVTGALGRVIDGYSRALLWLLGLPRRAVRGFVDAVIDTWVSDAPSYSTRLLSLALIVSGGIAFAGIVGLLFTQARIQGSSAPVILTFFDLVTNLWLWVIALIVLLRSLLFFQDRSLAQITALRTNYSYSTIRRLAEESRKPDMRVATRVLVQTGDTVAEIEKFLLRALKDGEGHEDPVMETASDDVDADAPETEIAGELSEDRADDEERPDRPEQPGWVKRRLMLLDIKSALDLEIVAWRFGAPATIAFLAQLALVRIWVRWWVYPIIIATSVFVGAAWYYVSDFRYRRRVRTLRQEGDPFYWGDLAILCKRVDVPETTMYYAWFAGKTYASPDADTLARKLALRADELVNDAYKYPSPAIEEKYARQLEEYVPTLDAWTEEVERPDIGDLLVETVHGAPEGLIPKNRLIEQVVETGRESRFGGLIVTGVGHDHELVEECYRDLVGVRALVEIPMTITAGDGSTEEVTAIRLGDDPLPANMASLRANFSERFQGKALRSRYSVPDVGTVGGKQRFIRTETATADAGLDVPGWWANLTR